MKLQSVKKITQILGSLFLKFRNRVLRETKTEVNSEWDRLGCSFSAPPLA